MASRAKPARVRITGDLYHPVVPAGAVRVTRPGRWGNPHKIGADCPPEVAVARFRADLYAGRLRVTVDDVRRELAGRDLACWCPLDRPCHADVLLEVANRRSSGEKPLGDSTSTR
jgi:Domain of unknown function (DUF4326)